jgi:EAL domain-containing protein (putative c-di-GMP-specific phosphodiesterase class I)/GGDEF domain-containing protein
MRTITEVINIIKESNYFSPWKDILLSDTAITQWYQLLSHSEPDDFYAMLGDRLYTHNVPYVIVTEYIDEFFRHINDHNIDHHQVKNKIAQAYLIQKLKDDNNKIQIELNKKLSDILEEKRGLINAHLTWMHNFICNVIGIHRELELDHTKCTVGRWLLEDESSSAYTQINEMHQNLHAMAQSALRMYQREDYAYFLLLYLDILMSSYQIRDLIMNIYFTKRFISIYRDPLSNQPNYFQLKHDIQENQEENSLFIFNVKEFSKINLLYGHGAGDFIIKEILDSLVTIDASARVYRIYGDEFAILFPTAQKKSIIQTFQRAFNRHTFKLKNSEILLSFYGATAKITPHVLERCEYGLMLSKTHHGHITDVDNIDETLLKEYANNITLSQELRLAFMDERIIPYFQPILDLQTNTITKFEVLMRVQNIHGDIMEPKDFLSVLQGMYIYPEVTKVIIKKSFEIFKTNNFDFSINLSFADIVDPETESFIIAMLKTYPDVASRCTFELLETEAIHNHKEVRDFFDLLHTYGVKLALDDFGVGYSNYDTIFQFDIDYIKIDGSLTESVLSNHKSLILIESIIIVAKELEAKLIVEFVSSKAIYDFIKSMEIDYVQGYYIGKPSAHLKTEL